MNLFRSHFPGFVNDGETPENEPGQFNFETLDEMKKLPPVRRFLEHGAKLKIVTSSGELMLKGAYETPTSTAELVIGYLQHTNGLEELCTSS